MANKVVLALERMLKLNDLMMKQVNHSRSAYNAECIKEMNEAPPQARKALAEYIQTQKDILRELDEEIKSLREMRGVNDETETETPE